MIFAPRAPGEAFSPADRRLLDDLARQAGLAAYTVRLTMDLQRSRERLVAIRAEERRRLSRDLHDGLGPVLTGQHLRLNAARNLLRRDIDAVDTLLADLQAQTQAAIADVRRLVYALRPPLLDELGLVAALRQHAEHLMVGEEELTNGGEPLSAPRITVEAPSDLPPLPAAVEIAAYRIVLEALANVVRHARARSCVVRMSLQPREFPYGDHPGGCALTLEVADDGVGIALSESHHTGLGLMSMRERAAELGGACVIAAVPGGGTRVTASLPFSNFQTS